MVYEYYHLESVSGGDGKKDKKEEGEDSKMDTDKESK